MSGHGIEVCLCGAVVSRCRCPGPHEKRVVQQVCPACRLTEHEIKASDGLDPITDLVEKDVLQ